MSILFNEDSTVQRYAWPGGYQILYLAKDGETLCPDCVQGDLEQCQDPDNSQWFVVAHFVN